MNALIIGGTGFTGPHVVKNLLVSGQNVALLNRRKTSLDLPDGVRHILGDRVRIKDYLTEIRNFDPDVVLDMIPYRQDHAKQLIQTLSGVTGRVVGLSSIDVYAAYGRIHRTEPGPLQQLPLAEDAELRKTKEPHGEDYDKLGIEEEFMGQSDIAGTILRLPAIYGPRDAQHRLYSYLKRMDDSRPVILLEETSAHFRFSRSYVENVAAAVSLVVTSEHAGGQTYNVAEPEALSEQEWVRQIGDVVGWAGRIVSLPNERLPQYLQETGDPRQHWVVDTLKIRQHLGFHEVVARREGLARTIEWERANPPPDLDLAEFDYEAEDRAVR